MANIRKDGFVSHVSESIKNGSHNEIFDVKKSQLAEGVNTEALDNGVKKWKKTKGYGWVTDT